MNYRVSLLHQPQDLEKTQLTHGHVATGFFTAPGKMLFLQPSVRAKRGVESWVRAWAFESERPGWDSQPCHHCRAFAYL